MSSIPNSAMPTAGPAAEAEDGDTVTLASRVRDGADRALGLVRDNPKTAIAAGAAVVAGAAAAAAIPLVRARRRSAANGASAPDRAIKTPARKRAPKRSAKKS
jgi:hypothetical protein